MENGDFNPHEREARDPVRSTAIYPRYNFNPHEREARDGIYFPVARHIIILIHTSVKLVTGAHRVYTLLKVILIHTSVKLVTSLLFQCAMTARF